MSKTPTPYINRIKELLFEDTFDYSSGELRDVYCDSFTVDDLLDYSREHIVMLEEDEDAEPQDIADAKELLALAEAEAAADIDDIVNRLVSIAEVRGLSNLVSAYEAAIARLAAQGRHPRRTGGGQ